MVNPEPPAITTRLQSRVDAHEEKIEQLATQMLTMNTTMNTMNNTITSMQQLLTDLPKSFESMRGNNRNKQTEPKTPFQASGSGSGTTLDDTFHPFLRENHFDDTLFSLPKVKLPQFDGTDPRGWLTKAELYFQVHHTPIDQKLMLAQMCMEGVALNWFTNLMIKQPNTDWGTFRSKLMTRFSGTKFRNAHEALGSLFDEGDVEQYIEEFEALPALIHDQSEEQSIGMFLRGLQTDVRNWVRTLNPKSCDQAMDFARHVAIATGRGEKKQNQGKSYTGWKPTSRYERSSPFYSQKS